MRKVRCCGRGAFQRHVIEGKSPVGNAIKERS